MDVLKSVRLLTASVDLYDQFNLKTGYPIGHQMESTRAAMTWMQGSKFTGHPLVISLTLVQIHVNAIEDTIAARNLIDQLSAIIRAIAPVHQEYYARRSPAAVPRLTREQCKTATAAAALVDEQPEMSADEIRAILKDLVDAEKEAAPLAPVCQENA